MGLHILKIIHIASGVFALLSGFFAILFRKNIKKHRPFGRIYFWCMTVIFVSSIIMALFRFNLFLLFIAIFTYHATTTAYRSLKLKRLHQGQKPLRIDWVIEIINVLANFSLIAFGLYSILDSGWQGGIIAITFGLIGLRNSYRSYKRLSGIIAGGNYWLIAHIGGMLGSYIGAITAFTVNNNRWMGLPEIVVWLGPSLVLIPFIVYETSRFKSPVVITK